MRVTPPVRGSVTLAERMAKTNDPAAADGSATAAVKKQRKRQRKAEKKAEKRAARAGVEPRLVEPRLLEPRSVETRAGATELRATAEPTTPELRLVGDHTPSLDELATLLGEPDSELTTLLVGSRSAEELCAMGQRMDTTDLLATGASFVDSTRRIERQLSAAQRRLLVGYTPDVLAVLVAEARALAEQHANLCNPRDEARIALVRRRGRWKAVAAQAIALRDQAYGALRVVLSSADRAELDRVVGTASSFEALRDGLRAVAGLVERLRDSAEPSRRRWLESLGVTDLLAEDLNATATDVERVGRSTAAVEGELAERQSRIERQDGVVVHLMGVVYRAFREAGARDRTIERPTLGPLRSFFEQDAGPRPPLPRLLGPGPAPTLRTPTVPPGAPDVRVPGG